MRITLKLWPSNNSKAIRYNSSKRRRIYSILRHEKFSKAYLKVRYDQQFFNDGFYENKPDLEKALSMFLEG
ncbi:hypothetical protein A2V80_01660 [Candidatus Woesebacteria bacterium RBG_16_39_8b]|uniref:Uncharacterized protein n=1 Tax=Candidatus Woesebacteria bacterium RBG_16_39_8b TaxID=1802482 RepID=A0A1F7XC74_9BACT|nr:MAG: hypothetical protein A2V80_01660 [Candidatus Woesebacteria bacterium RBG_16_39_8b]